MNCSELSEMKKETSDESDSCALNVRSPNDDSDNKGPIKHLMPDKKVEAPLIKIKATSKVVSVKPIGKTVISPVKSLDVTASPNKPRIDAIAESLLQQQKSKLSLDSTLPRVSLVKSKEAKNENQLDLKTLAHRLILLRANKQSENKESLVKSFK